MKSRTIVVLRIYQGEPQASILLSTNGMQFYTRNQKWHDVTEDCGMEWTTGRWVGNCKRCNWQGEGNTKKWNLNRTERWWYVASQQEPCKWIKTEINGNPKTCPVEQASSTPRVEHTDHLESGGDQLTSSLRYGRGSGSGGRGAWRRLLRLGVTIRAIDNGQLHQLPLFQVIFSFRLQRWLVTKEKTKFHVSQATALVFLHLVRASFRNTYERRLR